MVSYQDMLRLLYLDAGRQITKIMRAGKYFVRTIKSIPQRHLPPCSDVQYKIADNALTDTLLYFFWANVKSDMVAERDLTVSRSVAS